MSQLLGKTWTSQTVSSPGVPSGCYFGSNDESYFNTDPVGRESVEFTVMCVNPAFSLPFPTTTTTTTATTTTTTTTTCAVDSDCRDYWNKCHDSTCYEPTFIHGNTQGVWPSLVYYCPDGYSRITKKEECTSVVATALGKSLGVDQAVDAFPHGCYSGVDFWAVHFNTGEEGLRGGVAPVCQRPNPCEDVTCDLGGACDWTEGICKTTTTTTTTTISKTNGVVSSHECSTGVGSPCPAVFSESDVLGCCDCLAGTHLYGDNCVETCPDGFLQNENANGCEPSRQCVAYSAGSCPRNCVVLDEACQEPTPGESDSTSNDTASEQP